MEKFNDGERVYHRRDDDPHGHFAGYCRILENGPILVKVLFEDTGKEDWVRVIDLITEKQAKAEGL